MLNGILKDFIEGNTARFLDEVRFTFKLKNISVETKACLLDVSVGEYIDYLWHLDLLPVYTETEEMSKLIDKAVLGETEGLAAGRLRTYRRQRKEKFFEHHTDIEVVYELYKAGLSDLDISEVTGIEQYHVFTVTGLFRVQRQSSGA